MKLTYTAPSGRLTIEMDAPTTKAAFEQIATIEELFTEGSCGCCKSTAIRHDVRVFNNNKYYKLVCCSCGAQMDFGQNKDMVGLFAKRRGDDNRPLPNRGWYHYGNDAGHQDEGKQSSDFSLRPAPAPVFQAPAEPSPVQDAANEIARQIEAGGLALDKCKTAGEMVALWNTFSNVVKAALVERKDRRKAELSKPPAAAAPVTVTSPSGKPPHWPVDDLTKMPINMTESADRVGRDLQQRIIAHLNELGIDWSEVQGDRGNGAGLPMLAGFKPLPGLFIGHLTNTQGMALYKELETRVQAKRAKRNARTGAPVPF